MRGDVYRLRASSQAKGHEQQGRRFGVILQSDDLVLSTVIIAPTSRSVMPQTFRPTIVIDGKDTQVLLEQSLAVDLDRLGDFVAHVTHEEQLAIDDALRLVLELD